MSDEKSTLQRSRLLWVLGWTANCVGIYVGCLALALQENFWNNAFSSLFWQGNLAGLVLFCCEIAGAIVLFRTADPKVAFIRLTSSMLCGLFGLALWGLYYVAVPGYVIPFFNVLIALVVWQAVGVVVLFRTQKLWDWLAAVIGFSLPLTLWIKFGPVVFFRTQNPSDAKFMEIMARPDFVQLCKLDGYIIAAFLFLAFATFPGIWMRVFRLERKPAVASEA
jgi:hypothetical protein